MIGKSQLTAFLATSNPARSKAFYAKTLGLRLIEDDQFALLFDSGGVPLRIQKADAVRPHSFTALGWQVRSIRRVVAGLVKRGVVLERYPFLEQNEQGVWLAPSGTRVAWFKDPDGNILSVSESPR
ncbi:MAG TPA: VOC family protein [Gemmatimonadaceae bacterium]|nr:VOC family protein [Gemmatimonadaceae bacterium]